MCPIDAVSDAGILPSRGVRAILAEPASEPVRPMKG